MSRFNTLLVNLEITAEKKTSKILRKHFRQNFIIEVDTIKEGLSILKKMRIDLVVINLERENVDLFEIKDQFPGIFLVGLFENWHSGLPFETETQKVIQGNRLRCLFDNNVRELKAVWETIMTNRGRPFSSFNPEFEGYYSNVLNGIAG